jgi:hypothetical protein
MTIENCLAAKHSPANACTDQCKWPNACGQKSITVVEVSTIEIVNVPEVEEDETKPKKAKKPKGE